MDMSLYRHGGNLNSFQVARNRIERRNKQMCKLSEIFLNDKDKNYIIENIFLRINNTRVFMNLLSVDIDELYDVNQPEVAPGLRVIVSGKICSGKTTFCKILKEITKEDLTVLSVATPIKWIATKLFDMTKKDRKLCQTIGQEFRSIDPDIWTNLFVKNMKQHKNVLCDDVRFKNELDQSIKCGCITIRLNISKGRQKERIMKCYPDNYQSHLDNLEDVSETDLDYVDNFDYILDVDDMSEQDIKQFIKEKILNK